MNNQEDIQLATIVLLVIALLLALLSFVQTLNNYQETSPSYILYSGLGDSCLKLEDNRGDIINLVNFSEGWFEVTALGKDGTYHKELVRTKGPYNGSMYLSADISLLEIKTEGSWAISITNTTKPTYVLR